MIWVQWRTRVDRNLGTATRYDRQRHGPRDLFFRLTSHLLEFLSTSQNSAGS